MSIGYFWDDEYKDGEEALSKQFDCPRCKHRNEEYKKDGFICHLCVKGSRFEVTDEIKSNKFRELCERIKKKHGKK